MRHLRTALALAASLAVALTLVGAPAGTAAEPDGDLSAPAAARALSHAAAVLDGTRHRDVTLTLRALRLHRDDLSTADRASADRLLARPATDRSTCFTTVCVHWSTRGADAAKPGYVTTVAQTAEHVLEVYAEAGYRAPRSDGTRGGNGLLDIYLQDLGGQGYYGYCDGPAPTAGGPPATWAYCAFDNDYREFPAHTPLENLQVTAAHELFHAVQFGYDYTEDGWFMEATATWAEDELYDDVDDNRQYLSASPLAQPARSMDHFERFGVRQYGDWIFFRYLTERFPDRTGAMPALVRQIWERADSAPGAPDDYSIQAVARVLGARGTSLRTTWPDFAAANRRPGASYEEGTANRYPKAGLAGTVPLSARTRDSRWRTARVDHLASATYRITRRPDLSARHLRLRLDLPPTRRGSGAVVTTYRSAGSPETTPLPLTAAGAATTRLAFGPDVTYVEVTLANAGTHYRCWRPRDTGYSCRGKPRDDDLPLRWRVRALN